ncbi:MAG: DNA recombination protein RmuC [Candidatus Omnitrophota bacterium]
MIWFAAIIVIIAVGIMGWLLLRFSGEMSRQMISLREDLNCRLQETGKTLHDTHKTVGERLEGITGVIGNVIGSVQSSLGKMMETDKQLFEKLKEISSLQDMLRPPQVRGGIGETLLGNIITQVFGEHKEFYQFQYQFKSGEQVDAVIRLGGNLIPIDAKFPLESFQRMSAASTEPEKKLAKTDFANSVKKKINDIAAKYILPDEKTSDFAMMYIPSEPIYYEIIKDEQIWSLAISKKVIPVSPNTFYPYLFVIWRGLQGAMLKENIQQVVANLKHLQVDFEKVREDFRLLGNHLKDARIKYEDSEKRLERFSDKLINIQQARLIEERKEGEDGGK